MGLLKSLSILFLAASSQAQLIDLAAVNAAPDPTYTIIPGLRSQVVRYSEKAVLAAITSAVEATPLPQTSSLGLKVRSASPNERRAACDPQPTTPNIYNGDVSTPDAFVNDPAFAAVANNAVTPSGYNRTYVNLSGASNANAYMGYQMMNSYDVNACAAHCNTTNGCLSFNIFIERNPIVEPGYDTCTNPIAFANIKCSFWGGPVTPDNAQNVGQWRADFHVVIAASNGYVLMGSPSIYGYLPASPLETSAINAPLDCNGQGSYMGYRLFNDNNPYDVDRCAAACAAQNEYNIAHPPPGAPPQLCKFWNTYILARNGVSQGQYCSMYTQYWDPAIYATNVGQYDGEGNHFTIQQSYTFANMSDPGVPICPSDIPTLQQTAVPYCASYLGSIRPTSTTTNIATVTQGCDSQGVFRREVNSNETYGIFETVKVIFPNKSASPDNPGSPTTISLSGYVPSPTAIISPSAKLRRSVKDKRQDSGIPAIFLSHNSYEISSACTQVLLHATDVTVTATSTSTVQADCPPVSIPAPPALPSPIDPTSSEVEQPTSGQPTNTDGPSNGPQPTSSDSNSPLPPEPSEGSSSDGSPTLTSSDPGSSQTSTSTTSTGAHTIVPTRPALCDDGSPAYIIAGDFNYSPGNYDDSYFGVSLPFAIGIYGLYTQYVYVSVNGFVAFDHGVSSYSNTPLPWSNYNDAAAFAFWDDLYIFAGQSQYLAYTICGDVGSRLVTFEWKTGHYYYRGGPIYHFTATFYEDQPGFVEYQYLETPDQGGSATIGAQTSDGRQYFQYSFNQPIAADGLIVAFDTDGPDFDCGNQHLQWAWWSVDPSQLGSSYDPELGFDPTLYQTMTPNGQGITDTFVPFYQSNGYDVMNVYGQQIPGTHIVVETRGYIKAPQTGLYTFTISSVDNMAWIWVGPSAYSGWRTYNALVYAEIHRHPTGSGQIYMQAGQYYPFRVLFGQGLSPGYFTMSIHRPDGTLMFGTDPPSDPNSSNDNFGDFGPGGGFGGGFFDGGSIILPSKRSLPRNGPFVAFSCDGTTAPTFAAFGAEAPPQVDNWCDNFFCIPYWPGFGNGYDPSFPIIPILL